MDTNKSPQTEKAGSKTLKEVVEIIKSIQKKIESKDKPKPSNERLLRFQ